MFWKQRKPHVETLTKPYITIQKCGLSILTICFLYIFGCFHKTHVALTSRHTVCNFRILQMERIVWKTGHIIRYGILLTAGGISHLQSNLQNFRLGTISTLALEVIIFLAFFLAPEVIYVYTYIIWNSHMQKEYFYLVSDKWDTLEAVSEWSQKKSKPTTGPYLKITANFFVYERSCGSFLCQWKCFRPLSW